VNTIRCCPYPRKPDRHDALVISKLPGENRESGDLMMRVVRSVVGIAAAAALLGGGAGVAQAGQDGGRADGSVLVVRNELTPSGTGAHIQTPFSSFSA
jgi:hypothetical protein